MRRPPLIAVTATALVLALGLMLLFDHVLTRASASPRSSRSSSPACS